MKLNPPETAPKDALILAAFGANMYPAIWNDHLFVWMIVEAVSVFRSDWKWHELETEERECEEITGWLPMPQIDSEGNVA